MKHRKLRIAWSVAWGVLAVLLVGLWVRSYWSWDVLMYGWGMPSNQMTAITSQSGAAVIQYDDERAGAVVDFLSGCNVRRLESPDHNLWPVGGIDESHAGFLYRHHSEGFMLAVPYWFLSPLFVAFAVAPWRFFRSNRFSLRTLLIATTLVAVGLGLIAWVTR